MIKAIKEFFDRLAQPDPGTPPEHALHLATAALLIEMMHADDEAGTDELNHITHVLQTKFQLSAQQTDELVALARQEANTATDYFQFTSIINKGFDASQKQTVVELLWEVAFTDGNLDSHEEHMVRKIADLIHVPHSQFIAAKLRAQNKFK